METMIFSNAVILPKCCVSSQNVMTLSFLQVFFGFYSAQAEVYCVILTQKYLSLPLLPKFM